MRFNLKWKIGLAFGMFIPVIAISYLLSERADRNMAAQLEGMLQVHRVLLTIDQINLGHRDLQEGAWLYLITNEKYHLAQYEHALQTLPVNIARLHQLATDPLQLQRLAAIEDLLRERKEQLAAMLYTRERSGVAAASTVLEANMAKGAGGRMNKLFEEFDAAERVILKQRQEGFAAEGLTRQRVVSALNFAMLAAILIIGLLLTRALTLPVRRLMVEAERVGAGDLSGGNLTGGNDELGDLMQGFNRMVVQLRANIAQREASEALRQATEANVRNTLDITNRVVGEYQHFVAEVSRGDLTQRVSLVGDATGTLGQLGADLNSMTESLAHVASGTTEAINTIHSTLVQLQSSINSQSAGASEQAAAINQTTASLDQIKAMSAQTMEKVQVLGETAERSRRESEQGNAAVEQAIVGMNSIRERVEGIAQTILALSEQTQQIGEITAVVTNLAQQSKMLALNASIEAAKAGEAGKGFAVVAAEVRELAEQSQQSTAQVQKILQDIRHATDRAVMATEEGSKRVDAGMVSVQKSGEVMRQLGEVVRETAMVSQQITAVVRQGFIGLEQVTLAMKEINKVTTQFVSSAQQSKDSSAGLRRVAEHLRESVSTYKL